jgi:signal transduction histidine kinase
MTRALGILAPALGALALALTFLAMQGAAPDAARHERTLEALRAIILSDAALQRDVLRAQAGLLASYDPIVRSVDALNAAADALQTAGTAAEGATRAGIERRVADVAEAVRAQEARVEAFKSQNAVLRNSLAYFAHLSAAARGPEASGLANAMLRFTGGQRAEAAADVVAALDRLAGSASPGSGPLVAHGRLIVAYLPAVDSLVAQVLAAPIAERADAVQEAYLDLHGQAMARADRFRTLLYAAALALVIYIGHVFLRLRANARSLRSRVAFESLIAAISTDFIDLPAARIGAGVDAGLARLATHTGADRASVVLAGAVGVDRVHAWQKDECGRPGLEPGTVLAIAGHRELPGYESEGWIHVRRLAALPEGPVKRHLARASIGTWLCIPLRRTGDPLGFLAFDFLRSTHLPADDLALLRTAAEIFANAIARERGELERDALQDRLAEAQRLEAVGTLAGGIAHEFNNILGVILGAAEMALPAANQQVGRRLRQITTAAERAQGVVDQVLAFSRRRERRYRTLAVQPVVAEAVELLRASLPATVTLSVRFDAGGAAVSGDPTEVQQVVMNLCTNAAHAMDERGTLEVALDTVAIPEGRAVTHGELAAGAYVRLAVRDTGRGMDAATMERIFEPFFTTRPVGGGTGLGLSTVHGIVTLHGGALDVSSRPGRGSCFEAYWPQRMAPEEEAGAPAAPARGNGEAVLLVDDEPALVRMGEDMLAALGYEPVGFGAPGAALAAFRADPERFDLALLDEIMPEMTGRELAAALHGIRPNLPIVLMTGRPGAVPADRLGAAREVLAKPLRSASLAEGLARHLRRQEA